MTSTLRFQDLWSIFISNLFGGGGLFLETTLSSVSPFKSHLYSLCVMGYWFCFFLWLCYWILELFRLQYFLFYSFKSFSENANRGTFTLVWSIVLYFGMEYCISFSKWRHSIFISRCNQYFFSIYARNIYCHKYIYIAVWDKMILTN